MRLLGTAVILPIALAGAACPKGTDMTTRDIRSADLPPPRDGDIAIGEELAAARRSGTVAAYDLFIARHPQHPLAATARNERERLARTRQR